MYNSLTEFIWVCHFRNKGSAKGSGNLVHGKLLSGMHYMAIGTWRGALGACAHPPSQRFNCVPHYRSMYTRYCSSCHPIDIWGTREREERIVYALLKNRYPKKFIHESTSTPLLLLSVMQLNTQRQHFAFHYVWYLETIENGFEGCSHRTWIRPHQTLKRRLVHPKRASQTWRSLMVFTASNVLIVQPLMWERPRGSCPRD